MQQDNITRYILTLTAVLIFAAMMSALVMLGLMKSTLNNLETDTRVLSDLKWAINQGAIHPPINTNGRYPTRRLTSEMPIAWSASRRQIPPR